MSDIVISVEHLSKLYTIQHRNGDNGLRHAIHDFATAPLRWLRGQHGAWSKGHGATSNGNGLDLQSPIHNPRTPNGNGAAPSSALTSDLRPLTSEEFWALKDVSFEVKRGEVVGIIGRNGAGKSTLLKILSNITEPTSGRARIRGRVASLLEVGTGFHPELTGRENIFVNGAILGMTRCDILKRFDEIVAFAEIEKFLDTPVKRYSSGMYVRLAFAVAAHLEPDILLIDEVLAVGDAAFQKKCVGKMGNVAQEGRTILFVSHNMGAVWQLCTRCVLLQAGALQFAGEIGSAISAYLTALKSHSRTPISERRDRGGTGAVRVEKFLFRSPDSESGTLFVGCYAAVDCQIDKPISRLIFAVYDISGRLVADFDSSYGSCDDQLVANGATTVRCAIPELLLTPGRYVVNVAVFIGPEMADHVEGAVEIEVEEGLLQSRAIPKHARGVAVFPHRWSFSTATAASGISGC